MVDFKISSTLNVSSNKLFKDELKKSYTQYYIDQKDTKERITQEDLIKLVRKIWYDDKLSSEVVSKSFKTVGITLALNGSKTISSVIIHC